MAEPSVGRFLSADPDTIPEFENELTRARSLEQNPVVATCKSRQDPTHAKSRNGGISYGQETDSNRVLVHRQFL